MRLINNNGALNGIRIKGCALKEQLRPFLIENSRAVRGFVPLQLLTLTFKIARRHSPQYFIIRPPVYHFTSSRNIHFNWPEKRSARCSRLHRIQCHKLPHTSSAIVISIHSDFWNIFLLSRPSPNDAWLLNWKWWSGRDEQQSNGSRSSTKEDRGEGKWYRKI